ncbi:MAG: hypothetical protein WB818_12865, partial [Desulfobacterales bacterium]
ETRDIEIEMSQIDVNPLNDTIAQFFEFLHPSSTASVRGYRTAQQAEGGLFAIRVAFLCLSAKKLYFFSILTFRSIDIFARKRSNKPHVSDVKHIPLKLEF